MIKFLLSILSYGSAICLISLHILVVYRTNSSLRDPNGYDWMVMFFYGIPLAFFTVFFSLFALMELKLKRFRIPLAIGMLPILSWAVILLLEICNISP
jgi:hypothetical protein